MSYNSGQLGIYERKIDHLEITEMENLYCPLDPSC